jgi:superfamily I DNA and/or RNA helicase
MKVIRFPSFDEAAHNAREIALREDVSVALYGEGRVWCVSYEPAEQNQTNPTATMKLSPSQEPLKDSGKEDDQVDLKGYWAGIFARLSREPISQQERRRIIKAIISRFQESRKSGRKSSDQVKLEEYWEEIVSYREGFSRSHSEGWYYPDEEDSLENSMPNEEDNGLPKSLWDPEGNKPI